MKAHLIISLDYLERKGEEIYMDIRDLLIDFQEFWDFNSFEFKTTPKIGDFIDSYSLISKWMNSKEYEPKFTRGEVRRIFFRVLRTKTFKIDLIDRVDRRNRIFCSDIENWVLK